MAVYANLFMDQGTDFRTTINLEGGTGSAFDITDYDILAQKVILRINLTISKLTLMTGKTALLF